MSFKDMGSKLKYSYNSVKDDLINDFYNPVLSEATKYDRIAGFFNSTSLALATKGIDKFILNDGVMRLICCPKLSQEDLDLINSIEELKEKIDEDFLKDYNDIKDELLKNHIKLLGWMIANNHLEIKIGVVKEKNAFQEGLFHPKTGILYDEYGDYISFDGSVNESAGGWFSNIESLKVFRSWENSEYMVDDMDIFEGFWNNDFNQVEILDVPQATKNKLIEIAPKNQVEFDELILFFNKNSGDASKIKLRDYQLDALSNWTKNNFKGIFSMATGTGKTFTALSCFDFLKEKKENLLTVIVCPQKHLLSQWEENLKMFDFDGPILTASGDNSNWKSELLGIIGDIEAGLVNDAVVFTTFNTFSSDSFIDNMNLFEGNTLLIVDEVHGIGATEFRKGLEYVNYDYRLGLSATPEIEDDFERTDFVYDYFGGIVYEYDLKSAIENGFLTKYDYFPEFVELNAQELEEYEELTFKIINVLNNHNLNDFEKDKKLQSLIFERKRRIDNADSKYDFVRNFLKENPDIKDLIIYCTGEQLPKVQGILDEFAISYHKFTGEEKTDKVNGKSERDRILEGFANGIYNVLLGIKCLDEGVDVPSTKTALLMASTLNSRQHIQRRGRVLRNSPGKDKAEIYDLIVFPDIKGKPDYFKNIFLNEKRRYDEYADLAENFVECSSKLIEKLG